MAKKKRKNQSMYAILGMLATGSKSGYDIKKEAETKLSHFWRESFGQIYPLLGRMHEKGWVEKETQEQASRPKRHAYTITEEGKEALLKWLRESVEPKVARNELLLKLYFGEHMEGLVSEEHIRHHQAYYKAYLETLQKRHEELLLLSQTSRQWKYRLLTIKQGIHYCQSMLNWSEEALALLESWGEFDLALH